MTSEGGSQLKCTTEGCSMFKNYGFFSSCILIAIALLHWVFRAMGVVFLY